MTSPTSDLIVEPCVLDRDLDAIMAIDAASFTNPWTRDMFTWEAMHSDVAHIEVCRTPSGTVVAYCAVWIVFDELHVNTIAVAPEWRRHGVAKRLLERVFADAVERGVCRATLEVRRSNVAARLLYEGLGFEVRGERRGYYRTPPDDALILWKEFLSRAT